MFALIKAWECSDEQQEQFCNRQGVSLGSFGYWRTKYKRENNNPNPTTGSFIGLKPHLAEGLEVFYPNGVRVRLPQGSSFSDLQALIHLA